MLFLLVLIGFGTFIEGELVLTAAGFAIESGHISKWPTIAVAFLGAYCGDLLAFYVGRRWGQAWLEKRPKWAQKVEKMDHWIIRMPLVTLTLLRFQMFLRNFGNLIVGRGPISTRSYLVYNLLACALWAPVIVHICIWFAGFAKILWKLV